MIVYKRVKIFVTVLKPPMYGTILSGSPVDRITCTDRVQDARLNNSFLSLSIYFLFQDGFESFF